MTKKPWVLVVDDDPAVLSLVSERLEMAGFTPTTATDALQTFIQAESLKPILIFLDMNMPGFGTGADAIRALRQHPKTQAIPVIVLTGMELNKAKAMIPPDPKIRLVGKPPDWNLVLQYIKELTGIAGTKQP